MQPEDLGAAMAMKSNKAKKQLQNENKETRRTAWFHGSTECEQEMKRKYAIILDTWGEETGSNISVMLGSKNHQEFQKNKTFREPCHQINK